MANIGIVGYGVVGEATAHGFKFGSKKAEISGKTKGHKIKFYDKFKESDSLNDVVEFAEFIFVCLPTPYNDEGIDLSIIDETMEKITPLTDNTDKIIITKSTIVPGTISRYAEKYPNSNFCFSPEFLTEKNYLQDALNPDRIVIGTEDQKIAGRMAVLYSKTFHGVPIYLSNSRESELAKYMANTLLATKIIFANTIHELCDKMGLNYDLVKEMASADKRIGTTHLDVPGHDGKKGFGMKCFPKDLVALMGLYQNQELSPKLLHTVWKENLRFRGERDWDEIPFVNSNGD